MKKKFEFKVSTGITSILMIFVVLCLTAFGVLSYTSANADLSLSRKNAENIENYYTAESSINEKLSDIDGIIYRVRKSITSETGSEQYYENVSSVIKDKYGKAAYDIEKKTVTVTEKINEKQSLKMIIYITPNTEASRYEVRSMKVYTDVTVKEEEIAGFK